MDFPNWGANPHLVASSLRIAIRIELYASIYTSEICKCFTNDNINLQRKPLTRNVPYSCSRSINNASFSFMIDYTRS